MFIYWKDGRNVWMNSTWNLRDRLRGNAAIWLVLITACLCKNWVGPTSAFCVGVRPAVAPAMPAPPDTLRRWTHLFTPPHTRHDKTVLSVSCRVCRCELDDWCERVQTSDSLSATVLSWRESNSHRRSGGRERERILFANANIQYQYHKTISSGRLLERITHQAGCL